MNSQDNSEKELLEDAKLFLSDRLKNQSTSPKLQRAWDAFYRMYTDVIRRFVIRQGIHDSDVDDCTQNAWIYIVRKLNGFEDRGLRSGLRSWFYRVVQSVAVDFCRKQARRVENGKHTSECTVDLNVADSVRNDHGLTLWRQSMIAALLDRIRGTTSRKNIRIIEMRFLEGCNVTETAESLGLTPRQVWYRQHRVLNKLRDLAEIYTGGMFRPVESVDAP